MTHEDAHVYKMSNPICLTNVMVNCPICLLIFAFLTMFLIAMGVFMQDWLLPNDQSNRDFLVWGSEVVNEFDKAQLISDYLNTQTADDTITPLQSVVELGWNT